MAVVVPPTSRGYRHGRGVDRLSLPPAAATCAEACGLGRAGALAVVGTSVTACDVGCLVKGAHFFLL